MVLRQKSMVSLQHPSEQQQQPMASLRHSPPPTTTANSINGVPSAPNDTAKATNGDPSTFAAFYLQYHLCPQMASPTVSPIPHQNVLFLVLEVNIAFLAAPDPVPMVSLSPMYITVTISDHPLHFIVNTGSVSILRRYELWSLVCSSPILQPACPLFEVTSTSIYLDCTNVSLPVGMPTRNKKCGSLHAANRLGAR